MNDKELKIKDAMLAHIEQVIGMPIKFVPGDGENTPSGEIEGELKMAKKTEAVKVESKGTIAAKKAAATKKANAAAGVVAKATKKVVGAAKASAIKVAAWRFQDSGESGRYVYFRLVGAKGVELSVLNSIQVSLSRVPGGCVFGLDKLQDHDHHAPPFYNGGDGEAGDADQPYHKFGGEKSADAYLERVFTDITAEVAKVLPNVAVEFSKTPWTNKLPEGAHQG